MGLGFSTFKNTYYVLPLIIIQKKTLSQRVMYKSCGIVVAASVKPWKLLFVRWVYLAYVNDSFKRHTNIICHFVCRYQEHNRKKWKSILKRRKLFFTVILVLCSFYSNHFLCSFNSKLPKTNWLLIYYTSIPTTRSLQF